MYRRSCGRMIDVDHSVKKEVIIPFRPEKINRLLGTEMTSEEILKYLPDWSCFLMNH